MASPPDNRRHILALAPHAVTASAICRAVAAGRFSGRMRLRDICLAAGIASARSSAVESALSVGVGAGLFTVVEGVEWMPLPLSTNFEYLAIALEGIATYVSQVHSDATEVDVVLTLPEQPSVLEAALRARGHVGAMVDHTDAIFTHIAGKATERLIVLMPFIDETGMARLMDLWDTSGAGVERILITRHPVHDPNKVVNCALPQFQERGVKLFSYWIPKDTRYETFHAKVLLADRGLAYVGSANATKASLAVSMELGVLLTGLGASTIAEILEAILQIATPCSVTMPG